ncbi:MAG: hypothetical protein WDO73_07135 [Ignavibacteriota bacterium]
MTRRELLVGSAACTAPLWGRSHWDRTRISAITDEIGANPDDAASFAHNAGMLYVEVRNLPGSNREYAAGREADAQATAAHLANENLKVSVVAYQSAEIWSAGRIGCPRPGTMGPTPGRPAKGAALRADHGCGQIARLLRNPRGRSGRVCSSG